MSTARNAGTPAGRSCRLAVTTLARSTTTVSTPNAPAAFRTPRRLPLISTSGRTSSRRPRNSAGRVSPIATSPAAAKGRNVSTGSSRAMTAYAETTLAARATATCVARFGTERVKSSVWTRAAIVDPTYIGCRGSASPSIGVTCLAAGHAEDRHRAIAIDERREALDTARHRRRSAVARHEVDDQVVHPESADGCAQRGRIAAAEDALVDCEAVGVGARPGLEVAAHGLRKCALEHEAALGEGGVVAGPRVERRVDRQHVVRARVPVQPVQSRVQVVVHVERGGRRGRGPRAGGHGAHEARGGDGGDADEREDRRERTRHGPRRAAGAHVAPPERREAHDRDDGAARVAEVVEPQLRVASGGEQERHADAGGEGPEQPGLVRRRPPPPLLELD